jgi:hypothetical protein
MSFSAALSSSTEKVVLSYIEKVSNTYSLSKDELLSMWNGGGGGEIGKPVLMDNVPKELAVLSRNELVELCKTKKLKHGGTKNDLIQRIISVEKEVKTQPLINQAAASAPKLITKPAPPVLLSKNKFGNFEDAETHFVFNEKTRKVFGKQNADGSVSSLTVEDINICNKFKFAFDVPTNLQQDDDKVELAELDEDEEEEIEVEIDEEEDEEEEEEEVEVELEIDDDE